ncbi:guanine deaminase [Brienomyrus brachyistius]|uniref:guanine deaminase n=1 Tax=Brienomyrus brachyistius TaxID=42636 RepID=UPI0020B3EFD0|nr:guanine deaminase [Brienomyrus brachyistius]
MASGKVQIAQVYRGTFLHSTQNAPLEILEDRILGVGTDGKISFIESAEKTDSLSETWGFQISDMQQLGSSEFFMPGLIDTHIHAAQYSFMGTALDLPLLQWLETYTFPEEYKFRNLDYSRNVYTKVVERTLSNGTTTACYFASIYTDSSLLLGEIAAKFGQRALVGKVCMDVNDSLEDYRETTEESQEETYRFITELLNRNYPLVKPIITPRFAPSCTSGLLRQLGEMAEDNDLHVQSHISETKDEMELVKTLFLEAQSYTDVYLNHGLLTSKTVMAHGCHLTDDELVIFRDTGASIAHCPNSNISLCSGMLDVRNVLKHNVKLGLGTDIAGGCSVSMLDAIRRTMETSKALKINNPEHECLCIDEVFRLATLGGSQALSLDKETGNFEVGKDFDALRIDPTASESPFDVFSDDDIKIILEKFLYLGDDRNIKEVFVAGRRVVPFGDPI